MNAITEITRRPSVCPHDCPSVCALDVEVIGGKRIGRIHGARDQTYTSGVVCAKVARYWERIHHPDRLTQPFRRVGPKGSGQFKPIGWDEALDRVADNFLSVERELGPEGVWPYFYAGTMGLVMRDGIERLTHAKRYSRFHGTICVGDRVPRICRWNRRADRAPIRGKWRSRIASSSGARTRSPRKSMS